MRCITDWRKNGIKHQTKSNDRSSNANDYTNYQQYDQANWRLRATYYKTGV